MAKSLELTDSTRSGRRFSVSTSNVRSGSTRPAPCRICGRVHRFPSLTGELSYQDGGCDFRIPVNVISGFLGAGKTTFLNYILEQPSREKTDVMIREYGAVGIDDKLVKHVSGRTHVFPGISLHDDPQMRLHDKLHDLACGEDAQPFDRLLLETSGLDRPEALVHLFLVGYMPQTYRLGSFIVLVDAQFGLLDLEEYEVAVQQVAYADVIIVNKADLATSDEMDRLEERLRTINPMAAIHRASYGRIGLEQVMDVPLYTQLRELTGTEGGASMYGIQTVVLSEDRPMDKQKVNAWIKELFETKGPKLLRSKGFFCFAGEDWRYEFQGVRTAFHSKADQKWAGGEQRKSTVVLIGENLPDEQALRDSFAACVKE